MPKDRTGLPKRRQAAALQGLPRFMRTLHSFTAFYFCQSLMRSEDYVGANVFGVFSRKLFGEGDHADLAQTAAEHDVEPLIIGQGLRIAQIGQHAAADRHVAVASGAVSLKDSLAVLYHGFIG